MKLFKRNAKAPRGFIEVTAIVTGSTSYASKSMHINANAIVLVTKNDGAGTLIEHTGCQTVNVCETVDEVMEEIANATSDS